MSKMRFVWTSLAITALISTIVFIGGFIYATDQILNPQKQGAIGSIPPTATPSPSASQGSNEEDGIHILALGDSLSAGTGDMTGTGYVGHVKQKLAEQTGKPVYILNNLAVPGSRAEDLLLSLNTKRTQDAIGDADLILVSIGGNDLFQGGSGIFDEENPEQFNPAAIAERAPETLVKVNQILTDIRKYNLKATVVYLGLYHPFLNLDVQKTAAVSIQAWNAEVFRITNALGQVYVVPTYDLFEREQDRFLAADHFHPNGEGYERMATRIVQILK